MDPVKVQEAAAKTEATPAPAAQKPAVQVPNVSGKYPNPFDYHDSKVARFINNVLDNLDAEVPNARVQNPASAFFVGESAAATLATMKKGDKDIHPGIFLLGALLLYALVVALHYLSAYTQRNQATKNHAQAPQPPRDGVNRFAGPAP